MLEDLRNSKSIALGITVNTGLSVGMGAHMKALQTSTSSIAHDGAVCMAHSIRTDSILHTEEESSEDFSSAVPQTAALDRVRQRARRVDALDLVADERRAAHAHLHLLLWRHGLRDGHRHHQRRGVSRQSSLGSVGK